MFKRSNAKAQKIIIWKDKTRDNDPTKFGNPPMGMSDKLSNFVESFGLVMFQKFDFMPMVFASGTNEQIKTLKASGEVIIEDNGEVYPLEESCDDKPPNCS